MRGGRLGPGSVAGRWWMGVVPRSGVALSASFFKLMATVLVIAPLHAFSLRLFLVCWRHERGCESVSRFSHGIGVSSQHSANR